MRNRADDILKYKRGELSPKEMHALEKEALKDPFLADALEGIDTLDANQLEHDIQELNKRFTKQKNNSVVWPLRIAASIIIVLGAYWLFNQFPEQRSENLTLQKQTAEGTMDSIKSEPEKQSASDSKQLAEEKPIKNKIEKKDEAKQSGPVLDLIVSEEKSLASAGGAKTSPETFKLEETKGEVAPVVAGEKELAEVQQLEAAKSATQEPKRSEAARMKKAVTAMQPYTTITGKVTSLEDGSPIPGVNVIVKGTTQGAVTDVNGDYIIRSIEEKPSLAFSFIGFQTKEVTADQSKLDVQLNYDAAQLSEVVVTGYAINNADDQREPLVKLAEPFGGIKAYDNYLKTSLRYPKEALDKRIKGRVTVQFTVKTDGTLDEFNVLKGLGYGCDDEVIRLVKEGPKWSPTTEDNVAVDSEVRVKVRFTLPN